MNKMPKAPFQKLNKEKQLAILTAAKEEFEQMPYSEASINRMIKSANIARGSFYVYFQDKEDIYITVLQHFLMEPLKQRIAEQPTKKMNIFDYTVFYFNQWVHIIDQEKELSDQFFHFATISQSQMIFNETMFQMGHISFDNLRFQAPREKAMLIESITAILFRYLAQYTQQQETIEQIKTKLLKHLLLLKVGCQK